MPPAPPTLQLPPEPVALVASEPVALLPASSTPVCENNLRLARLEEQVSQLVQEQRQQQLLQQQEQQEKPQERDSPAATDLDATVTRADAQVGHGKGAEAQARELAQVKEELQRKVHECEILKEAKDMLAKDVKRVTDDRHVIKEALEEMTKTKALLEAQVGSLCSERDTLEGQFATSTEAARKLQLDRADLEAALDKSILETRDLRCRTAIAEEQTNKAEDRARKAEKECLHWQKKHDQCREELCVLQRKHEEQKGVLLDLECQAWRDRQAFAADPGQSPGDRMKAAKYSPHSNPGREHATLTKELTKTRCDLDLTVQKIRDQRYEIQQLRARQ